MIETGKATREVKHGSKLGEHKSRWRRNGQHHETGHATGEQGIDRRKTRSAPRGETDIGFFIVNNATGTNDNVEMDEGTATASASGFRTDSSFDPALILPESSMTAAARRLKRGGNKGANSTLTAIKGRKASSPASRGESHVSEAGVFTKPQVKKQAAKKAVKAIEKSMEAANAKATVTDTALDSTTVTTTAANSDKLLYHLVKTEVCGIKTRNPHGNGVVDKYEYNGKGRGDKKGNYHPNYFTHIFFKDSCPFFPFHIIYW